MTIDRGAYLRDGFLLVRGLLAESAIDEALDEIRAIFNAQADRLELRRADSPTVDDVASLLARVFMADSDAFRAAARLVQWSVTLQRLSACEAFVGVARALGMSVPVLATRPVLHIMGDRLKIPGSYHTTPPHQDWRAVQGSLDQLNLWVPFHDVDGSHYPLQIVPKSHLLGLLESEPHGFGHRVVEGLVDEKAFRSVEMRKGDVIFFSGFIVHRTGPSNASDALRLSASFRFNNAAEATFVRRRYPIPYFQTDMTLLPDPPPRDDVVRFFSPSETANASSNSQTP